MAQPARIGPTTKPLARMSYEEFLNWPGENQHVEWVNGEVLEMSPVSRQHTAVVGFLIQIVREFVAQRRLGEVLFEPFNMKIGRDLPRRAPDLLFVSTENLGRLKRNRLEGPADLVVEVISPDDPDRDRVDKFGEYERGGVREYWILDPEQKSAKFYVRSVDGRFEPATVDENGV